MGIYLNPNNDNFTEITNNEIYVDKTMMISALNRIMKVNNKYICVSRPRRFGKTIAGNMLSAYFSKGVDSRELFAPYKISRDPSFESNLNKLNVIKIDVNSEFKNEMDTENLLKNLQAKIVAEFIEQFPDLDLNPKESVGNCILKAYAKRNEHFVVIMDEYDVLVRENVSEKLFHQYLDFLNGLFKSDTLRPAISLAYLTGVLPIIRDRIQSKLNNFDEYTILSAGKLAEFIGFTSDEVKELCEKYNADYEEYKRWYDGYSQRGIEIYNPESVVKSLLNESLGNYWSKTSTYAVISDRIQENFEGMKDDVIKMLSGESVPVNVTRYMNTMTDFSTRSDAFTYLIHLGYLAYDAAERTVRIPNKEIREEFALSLSKSSDSDSVLVFTV